MKIFNTPLLAATVLVLTGCGIANRLSPPLSPVNTKEIASESSSDLQFHEKNKAWTGMFFSSEYVVEEYEYDDAYCLLYDDADANMFNVEICVDLETYQMVKNAVETGKHLVGTLVLNDDYSCDNAEVFTYMPDPEFEMAEASAKCPVIEMECWSLKH